MADGKAGKLLQQLLRSAGGPPAATESDGRLLGRFVRERDEAAFAALVQRHGPLVLGVCRRVLRDGHAAEDAFQATFLVLLRRANALDRRGSLAGWLYGVAYRVALRDRGQAARWQASGAGVPEVAGPLLEDEGQRELRAALDDELRRLPAKYRLPLILCHFQGKTHQEAAVALGWPCGSMAKRLARGQELLRGRLSQRGLAPVSAAVAACLAGEVVVAVPPALVRGTLDIAHRVVAGEAAGSTAVVALGEGVVREMFRQRLLLTAALLLTLGVAGIGVGLLGRHWLAGEAQAVPLPEDAQTEPVQPWIEAGKNVLLDPSRKIVYLRTGDGELSAVDLKSGGVLWKTDKAFLPLAGVGKRLLALTAGGQEGTHVLVLDTTQNGAVLRKSELLPTGIWVDNETPIAGWMYSRPSVRGHVEQGNLVVTWSRTLKPFSGVARPQPYPDGSGKAHVDLQTGKVKKIGDRVSRQEKISVKDEPQAELPPGVKEDLAKVMGRYPSPPSFPYIGPFPPSVPRP